jgi:hypothetical protein
MMTKRAVFIVSDQLFPERLVDVGDVSVQVAGDNRIIGCCYIDNEGMFRQSTGNGIVNATLSTANGILGVTLTYRDRFGLPEEYFADLIAYGRIPLHFIFKLSPGASSLACSACSEAMDSPRMRVINRDTVLGVMFDPAPDPRLIRCIHITWKNGNRFLGVCPCWEYNSRGEVTTFFNGFSRDVFREHHNALILRSQTSQGWGIVLSRGLALRGRRQNHKLKLLLGAIRFRSLFISEERFWNAEDTHSDRLLYVIVESTVAELARHDLNELRRKLAAATGRRVMRNVLSEPGQYLCLEWDYSRARPVMNSKRDRFFSISWFSICPRVVEIAMVFARLRLPTYVLLWILQWIEQFGTQNEARMVRLIESVTKRSNALIDHRHVCEEKGLRARPRFNKD